MKPVSYFFTLGIGIALGFWFKPPSEELLGQKNVQMGSVAKEIEIVDKLESDCPSLEPINTSKANSSDEIVDIEKTIKPRNVILQKDEFDMAFNLGDYDLAKKHLNELERLYPDSIQFFESKTRYLVQTREWQDSKPVLKECLKRFPRSKSCLIDLSSVELQIGNMEDKTGAVQNCLRVMPNDPQCRNMSAIVKMNQGDFSDAVLIYENLLKNNGDNGVRFSLAMLHWQLGIALEGAGRTNEAHEQYVKACKHEDQNACIRANELSESN